VPTTFGAASLFIDDCPDAIYSCVYTDTEAIAVSGTVGYCWDRSRFCCGPCNPDDAYRWSLGCLSHEGAPCTDERLCKLVISAAFNCQTPRRSSTESRQHPQGETQGAHREGPDLAS
jgi:hypothetical protein